MALAFLHHYEVCVCVGPEPLSFCQQQRSCVRAHVQISAGGAHQRLRVHRLDRWNAPTRLEFFRHLKYFLRPSLVSSHENLRKQPFPEHTLDGEIANVQAHPGCVRLFGHHYLWHIEPQYRTPELSSCHVVSVRISVPPHACCLSW